MPETTTQESGVGDINMTTGWTLLADGEGTPKVRPTLYVKVPSGDLDRGLGTGTMEAGPGLSVSKWLGNVYLFGEGAYIFQNSKSDYPGRNYVSYLGGAGIRATDRLFVSALAKARPRAPRVRRPRPRDGSSLTSCTRAGYLGKSMDPPALQTQAPITAVG